MLLFLLISFTPTCPVKHETFPKMSCDIVLCKNFFILKHILISSMAKQSIDELVKVLSPRIKELNRLIEQMMPGVNKEIDWIVQNKEQSQQRIERLLDELTNYLYQGYGKKEFKRLNKYYASINKEAASDYARYFKEIITGK